MQWKHNGGKMVCAHGKWMKRGTELVFRCAYFLVFLFSFSKWFMCIICREWGCANIQTIQYLYWMMVPHYSYWTQIFFWIFKVMKKWLLFSLSLILVLLHSNHRAIQGQVKAGGVLSQEICNLHFFLFFWGPFHRHRHSRNRVMIGWSPL